MKIEVLLLRLKCIKASIVESEPQKETLRQLESLVRDIESGK